MQSQIFFMGVGNTATQCMLVETTEERKHKKSKQLVAVIREISPKVYYCFLELSVSTSSKEIPDLALKRSQI